MKKSVLMDSFAFKPVGKPSLVESASGEKVLRRTGVFQNFLVVNENNRNYPESIWDRVLAEDSDFSRRLKGRGVVGLIEHPDDGMTRLDRGISHVIVEVHKATSQEIADSKGEIVEGDIVGTLEILPTRQGRELAALIEANIPFGVSSRGNGDLREGTISGKTCYIVEDDFELETWDVVFNPSVKRAVPKDVTESVKPPVTEGSTRQASAEDFKRFRVSLPPDFKPSNKYVVVDEETLASVDDNGNANVIRHIGKTYRREGDSIVVNLPKEESVVTREPSEEDLNRAFTEGEDSADKYESLNEANIAVRSYDKGSVLFNQFAAGFSFGRSKRAQRTPTTPAGGTGRGKTPTAENKNITMSIKQLELDVLRLVNTPHSGLKRSEIASIFEAITNMREAITTCLAEDASAKVRAEKLHAKLNEFEEKLDTEPTPAAPAAPAEPIEVLDCGAECELLDRAAAKLKELAGDDEEALELSDDLSDIVAGIKTPEVKIEESDSSAVKVLKTRFNAKANQLKRLAESTGKLVERYKALRSSRPAAAAVSEAQGEGEYKKAAKGLASKYNADMKEMGLALLKVTKPVVFEANKTQLEACKTYKQFEDLVESLLAKAKANPVRESRDPRITAKRRTEVPAVTESTHPSLKIVRSMRG